MLASGLLFLEGMRQLLVSSLLVACGFQAPDRPGAGPDAAAVSATPDAAPDAAPDAVTQIEPTPLTPQTLIERLITIACEQAFVCKPQYPSGAASFDVVWGTDLNDCVATDRDYLQREAIAAAVVGGTISFDPAQGALCLATPGIPTNCATLFSDNYFYAPTCLAALAGHVPEGGVCTTDWECPVASTCRSGECMR